jgi:hypothetical protein
MLCKGQRGFSPNAARGACDEMKCEPDLSSCRSLGFWDRTSNDDDFVLDALGVGKELVICNRGRHIGWVECPPVLPNHRSNPSLVYESDRTEFDGENCSGAFGPPGTVRHTPGMNKRGGREEKPVSAWPKTEITWVRL